MNRRWVYAALLVFAALLILGTGGFSAMSADRGVSVAVADDEEAYVGYEATCDGPDLEITITNQFDSELTDGSVTVGGEQVSLLDDEESIGPGETETVTFNGVDSGSDVTVTVEGEGISAELDRAVPCTAANGQDVNFPGDSDNVVIFIDDPSGIYWTANGQQNFTADDLKGKTLKDSDESITAVYLDSTNATYKRCGNGGGVEKVSGEVDPDEIECQ